MKKLLSIGLTLALLAGCSSQTTNETPVETEETVVENLNILAPTGAPGYSLVPLVENNTVTLMDGADVLQAAFVNPNAEYDVIIAPTNLGVKLAAAGKTDYKLAGIITTGNLYVVAESEDALTGEGTVALFGETAVPGLVYNKVDANITLEETWYSAVTEAQAALLTGNATAALLADPAATATIAKGKESGKEFKKVLDIQELWGEEGYPMASMFVKSDTLEDNADVYAEMLSIMQKYSEDVIAGTVSIQDDLQALEDAGNDLYTDSVAYAMVQKAYEGMGIHPTADIDTDNLNSFLQLFDVTFNEDVLAKLD